MCHFREADNNLFVQMIMIFVTLMIERLGTADVAYSMIFVTLKFERLGTADIAYSHLLQLTPFSKKKKKFSSLTISPRFRKRKDIW